MDYFQGRSPVWLPDFCFGSCTSQGCLFRDGFYLKLPQCCVWKKQEQKHVSWTRTFLETQRKWATQAAPRLVLFGFDFLVTNTSGLSHWVEVVLGGKQLLQAQLTQMWDAEFPFPATVLEIKAAASQREPKHCLLHRLTYNYVTSLSSVIMEPNHAFLLLKPKYA